jgi:hypothetical protein
MSEQPQNNNPLPPAPADQDVIFLIKRLQQQLTFLEKKIDLLVNQSQARPSQEKPFSKPFRSFGPSHRRPGPGGDYPYASGKKSFDRGHHFEKRPGEAKEGFGYKKKPYAHPEGGDPGQGHHFEKRHGGEKKSFDPKKKPFYFKYKDGSR